MPRRPPPTFGNAPQTESRSAQLRQDLSAADLAAKYAAMDADRRRLAMDQARLDLQLKAPLPEAPKSKAQKAAEAVALAEANVLGAKSAEQRMALPGLETTVAAAFKGAKDLLAHPGFEATVGMPNPFKGGFGPLGTVRGTPARDFQTLLNTYTSKLFPAAVATLRGTGPISNVEGQKALESLANLPTDTSEAEFKRQLQTSVDTLAREVDVARKKASMGGSPFTYEELMREKRARDAKKGQR
jgi:hypothetical protein